MAELINARADEIAIVQVFPCSCCLMVLVKGRWNCTVHPQISFNAFVILLLQNIEESTELLLQSATTAWSQVFYGLEFREGDRILTSFAEYGSNFIAFLQVLKMFLSEMHAWP